MQTRVRKLGLYPCIKTRSNGTPGKGGMTFKVGVPPMQLTRSLSDLAIMRYAKSAARAMGFANAKSVSR
jgi:hypothetical protein